MRATVGGVVLLFLAVSIPLSAGEAAEEAGLVVEAVRGSSAAHRAGLRPGDVLLAWHRGSGVGAPRAGKLVSPYELRRVELEEAPLGQVALTLQRGDERQSLKIPAGRWALVARPRFDAAGEAIYAAFVSAAAAKQEDVALARLRELKALQQRAPLHAVWLDERIGEALARARRFDEARLVFAGAVERASKARWTFVAAELLVGEARLYEALGERSRAAAAYSTAIAEIERSIPDSLTLAMALTDAGNFDWEAQKLDSAIARYRAAVELRRRLAPESLDLAGALSNLGNGLADRGDVSGSLPYLREAVDLAERVAGQTVPVASLHLNYAATLLSLGDLDGAEAAYARAVDILTRVSADSMPLAEALAAWAFPAIDRGDYVTAEERLARALRIVEANDPDSLAAAKILNTLASAAYGRRDLAEAERQYLTSLALKEKHAPETLHTARTLSNLAVVLTEKGDLEAADKLQRRALVIKRKIAPSSPTVAASLASVAKIERRRGELGTAAALLDEAMALERQHAPEGLAMAEILFDVAVVKRLAGELDRAEEVQKQALAIRQRRAPASAVVAESLYELAVLRRQRGDLPAARKLLTEAIAALEAQKGRLGGSEDVKTTFGETYAPYYRQLIELLLEDGQAEAAFHVLERSRAARFLALLAERDLRFGDDIPSELARQRGLLRGELRRLQTRSERLDPATQQEAAAAVAKQLAEVRMRVDAVEQQIRVASPRLAKLTYPKPMSAEEARAALGEGTLLLSYSIGDHESYVLALQPRRQLVRGVAPLTAYRLGKNRRQLRESVERFRSRTASAAALRRPVDDATARELYDVLLRPVAKLLGASKRVLIVPDAALHFLPFGALAHDDRGKRRYLIEDVPLHVVLSATVYGELRAPRQQRREEGSAPTLVAFGDPRYPSTSTSAAPAPLPPALRNLRLEPLPDTRREVEQIAALYGASARRYVGEEATEERAKSVPRSVRYLHFASHGFVDEGRPLDSALALTIRTGSGEGENGLLQAWEVLEHMRLDAELVTLSACETALGREAEGEGLIGLTRAFQYAGARSVVASLWSVSDESTATLMTAFYRNLRNGMGKDEALRAAQLSLLRGPHPHPFHWAAFQLIGAAD